MKTIKKYTVLTFVSLSLTLTANALLVTFQNTAASGQYHNPGSVGDNITANNQNNYSYADDYGGYTPDITFEAATNTRIWRTGWLNDAAGGGTTSHNGVYYRSGSQSGSWDVLGFTLQASGNNLVSLRHIESTIHQGLRAANIGFRIELQDEAGTWSDYFQGGNGYSTLAHPEIGTYTQDWATGEIQAKAIRVGFDLGVYTQNQKGSFGISRLGFEQIAVPEPSVYALILGGLALGWVALKRRIS